MASITCSSSPKGLHWVSVYFFNITEPATLARSYLGSRRYGGLRATRPPLSHHRRVHPPSTASQTCTVLSALAEAMRLPSGDHTTAFTAFVCPL